MRRIAAIQDEHVTASETRQHAKDMVAFTRCEGGDLDVNRCLGAHVEQDAHEHLWTVAIVRNAKGTLQFGAALQVDLRAIDGEDSPAVPALRLEGRLVGGRGDLVQHVAQQVGAELVPRSTERGRRDRLFRGQRQPMAACFVPEAIEQVPIAAPVSVGDHVQQQGGQQRGTERAATREVAWVLVETPLVRRR